MKGFNVNSSTRSSLGWETIRLIKECNKKPRFVIYENVANITSKKFKDTLDLFKSDLEELGYTLYDQVLNAVDYGIPQTRKRYFLIGILNNEKEFSFPEPIGCNKVFKDLLDKEVDEKYYLTTDEYKVIDDNKIQFHKKNREDVIYEIDLDKYEQGGVCGIDKHCKFAISSRVFSELGYAPTLTANNTADNAKVIVKGE